MASRSQRRIAQELGKNWKQKGPPVYNWARGRQKKKAPDQRWNIVKGDRVKCINGPYRGQSGVVQVVLRASNRLIVEGVNVRKRMLYDPNDPDRVRRPVDAPASVHYSNFNLICPLTQLPTRVKRGYLDDGTLVRVAVRSGGHIPMPEFERKKPKNLEVGDKDTEEDAVNAVTYDPLEDQRLWASGFVDGERRLF